jgi:hypothetical protein
MIPDDQVPPKPIRHLRILGICWVLYGILCLVSSVGLFLFRNTATVMFGALLSRVRDPFSMMNLFHFLYGLRIAIAGATGILGIMAGFGLLGGARFAKTLAIVAAFLSLSSIPLGTTLGIYSLIVLLTSSHDPAFTAVSGVSAPNVKRLPLIL